MTEMTAGAVCVPNFTGAGRKRRVRVAQFGALVSVVTVVAHVALGVAWPWRLLVFLPAAVAGISGLQVRRNTCVARAAEGTIEHDDFSKTPAPPDQLAVSRRVARGIRRDGFFIGVAVAALSAALAFAGG